ncbi:MAG: rhodanese-like domain-containing protein [Candidatus Hodarchaeota archaeon]
MRLNFSQLNPHACQTYLIGEKKSNQVALVDPVLDHVNDYLKLLNKENWQLTEVIDTHTHADHISGAAALKDVTDCEYIMHKKAPSQCVTKRVTDGIQVKLAGISAQIMYTPGHTNDSVCVILSDKILTGDVLFLDDGGAGRDDLPGGNPGSHWESLQRILALPEHLIVFPAHEYRNRVSSSLKQQKKSNPHLQPRTKTEFVEYLEDLKLGPADWMEDVLKANYACARDPKAAWIPVDTPVCEVKGTLALGANEQEVRIIEPNNLKMKLDLGQEIMLLDVREAHELKGPLGHLEDVKHISIVNLAHQLSELEKNKEIIVLCRSGARAYTAAQILAQAGFPRVSVLNGGMIAWRQSFDLAQK